MLSPINAYYPRSSGAIHAVLASGAGPVIMVQLEPEKEHDKLSSEVQRNVCPKRFLHVTDFAGAQSFVAANGKYNEGRKGNREVKEGETTTDPRPVMEHRNRAVSQYNPRMDSMYCYRVCWWKGILARRRSVER